MDDEISPKSDHHEGGLNQNDPLKTITAPPNVLASRPLVRRNSAQSSHSKCISNHKPQASYQATVVPKETRGKILNLFKASLKHCFPSGNKSKNLHGHNSPNLGPPITSSTTVQHVGTTKLRGLAQEDVQNPLSGNNFPGTPANPLTPSLGSPGSPMSRCATAFSE